MSEKIRESLSALMDGESQDAELELVLEHSQHPDVRASWVRYHAVRQAVTDSGRQVPLHIDISARVSAALDSAALDSAALDSAALDSAAIVNADTPTGQLPDAGIKRVARWHDFLRPLASLAVAASVFATVLVGSQWYGLLGDPGAVGAPATDLASRGSPVGLVNTMGGAALSANYGAPAVKSNPARQRALYNRMARQRLQRYLLPHTEEAALNSPQGMMPYARLATFEVEQ